MTDSSNKPRSPANRSANLAARLACGIDGLAVLAAPKARHRVPNVEECVRHALDELLALDGLAPKMPDGRAVDVAGYARKLVALLPGPFDAEAVPPEAEALAREALRALGIEPPMGWVEFAG